MISEATCAFLCFLRTKSCFLRVMYQNISNINNCEHVRTLSQIKILMFVTANKIAGNRPIWTGGGGLINFARVSRFDLVIGRKYCAAGAIFFWKNVRLLGLQRSLRKNKTRDKRSSARAVQKHTCLPPLVTERGVGIEVLKRKKNRFHRSLI